MATIRENKKNGKTVSYRFTVCLERDIIRAYIEQGCVEKYLTE